MHTSINGYFFLSLLLHAGFAVSMTWLGLGEPRPYNQGTIEVELTTPNMAVAKKGHQTKDKESSSRLALSPTKPQNAGGAVSKPKKKKIKLAKKPVKKLFKKRSKKLPKKKVSVAKNKTNKNKVKKKWPKKTLPKKTPTDINSEIEKELADADITDIEDAELKANDNQGIKLAKQIAKLEEMSKAGGQNKQDTLAHDQFQQGSASNDLQNGVPTGVRDVSQLEAVPGNRPPFYDVQDRLKKRQGTVVLRAYVTSNGRVKDIRLMESSYHESLDSKTIKAFRKYRFYPGQEGWVQMEFIWTLRGEAERYQGNL